MYNYYFIYSSSSSIIIGDNTNATVNIHNVYHHEHYEVKGSYNQPASRFDNDRAIEGIFNGVSNILSHILE